ncbi:MAG: tetratricopeptide repeat protein [Desulfuromonadaceae bacterium]
MMTKLKTRFSSPRAITGLHVFLVVLLGLVCYYNSFSVPFMFDDISAIVKNPDITGGRNLWDILLHGGPRRIADFSFAVNYRFHALQVAGYHVINLAIHLSAAVVLYFLTAALLDALELTYPSRVPEANTFVTVRERFIPLATALVFVCHPLQTQAVTYLVQRHTSLATLFYLLALLAYVKGRITLEQHGLERGVLRWGLLLSAMALLAFHTKQISFSMPLMMVMLELGLFRGRLFKRYLIIAAVTGVLLLLAMFLPAMLNGSLADIMFDLRRTTSEDLYFSRTSYFLTQTRVIVTYLRLLVLPVQQNLDYDYPIFSSLQNIEVIASMALHGLLLTAAYVLYRRSQHQLTVTDRQSGLALRLIALGIAWFYIALIIESSFIPITDVIMEHRVYLPSAGFCIALAAFVMLISRKLHSGVRCRWLALAAVCLLFATLTIARNRLWNDEVRFWLDAAAKSPRKGRVHSNLGLAYLRQNRFEMALRLFVDAIKLDPTLNSAWMSLGSSLQGMNLYQGRFTSGMEYLTPGGEIDFRWYRQFNSSEFNNMGLACEFVGQPEEALNWYIQSVNMNPDFDLAWFNLGLLSARLGNYPQRDKALSKLHALNPALANKLTGDIRPDRSVR